MSAISRFSYTTLFDHTLEGNDENGLLIVTDLETNEVTATLVPFHLMDTAQDVLMIAETVFEEDPTHLLVAGSAPLYVSSDLYVGILDTSKAKELGYFDGCSQYDETKGEMTLIERINQAQNGVLFPQTPRENRTMDHQFDEMLLKLQEVIDECPHPYKLGTVAKEEYFQFHFHALLEVMLLHQIFLKGGDLLVMIGAMIGENRPLTPEDREVLRRLAALTPIQRALLEQQILQQGEYRQPNLVGIRTDVLADHAARVMEHRREALYKELLTENPIEGLGEMSQEERQILALMICPEELASLRRCIGQLRSNIEIESNKTFLKAFTRIFPIE